MGHGLGMIDNSEMLLSRGFKGNVIESKKISSD